MRKKALAFMSAMEGVERDGYHDGRSEKKTSKRIESTHNAP